VFSCNAIDYRASEDGCGDGLGLLQPEGWINSRSDLSAVHITEPGRLLVPAIPPRSNPLPTDR